MKKYNILSIPCILTNMIEKEQQCEAFIESKKCLDFILNEVEKDMDKNFICDVLHLQNSNTLIFNSGYNFPLNCNENEYFFTNIMVNTNKITQIFSEKKVQSENYLWVKIRNDRISASLKAYTIKSCKDLSIKNQDKLAISLLTNKNLGYQGKINVAYGKKFDK